MVKTITTKQECGHIPVNTENIDSYSAVKPFSSCDLTAMAVICTLRLPIY